MLRIHLLLTPFLIAILLSPALLAQEPPDETFDPIFDPIFVGYETEPGMDFGGRTVASVHSVVSRAFGSIPGLKRHPGVAPAYEFPVAAALLLVQHEVGGHGGRGREFGLGPSYVFNYDFSGGTSLDRSPRTHEENILLAAGGAEADGVLAHRILLDALRPDGVDGAKIPLAFMTKLDLTLYILQTADPEDEGEDGFVEQYQEGNDVAFYLVARQAQRRGADPEDVWNGVYAVDRSERLLQDMSDDLRTTAVWNVLDPSLVSAVFAYFRDHVIGGRTRVHPPVLRLGNGLGLTLGTRAALGPQEASRFLDLHAATRWGVLTFYLRDLDSSIDRTYGYGAAVHGLQLGEWLALGLQGDTWDQPDSREGLYEGTGWNVSAELDARLGTRWGLAAKVGSKSDGFFPGRPIDEGVYAGFGVTAVW